MKSCPKCKSENVKLVDHLTIKCLICLDCGFDERTTYDVYPSHRTNQKEKGNFSPYKAGGSKRTS
jgi:hypothetical protein